MISVAYEDEWLLVVNKPAGLLTIPAPGSDKSTLTDILNENLEKKGILYRLHPCHRLDKETSGLIIYAKGKAIQKKMMDEFKAKTVKKKYIAFLNGALSGPGGCLKNPVSGLSAITNYKVIAKKIGFSVVEAQPLSGRTNQLRIHFKQLGHPILGDDRFAFRRDFKVKSKRLCLHARDLEFIHPVTRKTISLACALPPRMQELLEGTK